MGQMRSIDVPNLVCPLMSQTAGCIYFFCNEIFDLDGLVDNQ